MKQYEVNIVASLNTTLLVNAEDEEQACLMAEQSELPAGVELASTPRQIHSSAQETVDTANDKNRHYSQMITQGKD